MKSILPIFLFLTCQCLAQSVPDSIIRNIDLLVTKSFSETLSKEERSQLRNQTFIIQNTGLSLGEQKRDREALKFIDQALEIWVRSKDTLNEANNRKFRGMLLGNLKRFTEAKKDIALAIKLYMLKKVMYGVAVSQFDLARVYDVEAKFDSAIMYSEKSLKYWSTTKDTSRIVGCLSQLINLHTKNKNYDAGLIHQKEGIHYISGNLHSQQLLDFYLVSSRLFGKMKSRKLHKAYVRLYRKVLSTEKSLKNFMSSYYDL